MVAITDFGSTIITNARDLTDSCRLDSFWSDGPCALFFLRRLGCPICRCYIKTIETIRQEYEAKGILLVALSFEKLGEGSDSDRSFEKGGYWNGPIYTIDKKVYESLFGRKGLFDSFYGLLDMNKEAYAASKGTPGNFKGDGFQLGGQFILREGGVVELDHRQKAFGDDAPPLKIVATLDLLLGP